MNEIINNRKRVVYPYISILLVLVFIFTMGMPAYTAAAKQEINYYVKEVKIFYGDTLDDAKQKCIDEGFKVVEGDLNEGSKGQVTVLGYTTTDNKDEAIYDLRTLEMNTGYQYQNLGNVADAYVEKLGPITVLFQNAAKEFKKNYADGNRYAIAAKEYLDIYHIDEKQNMKFGEYLVSNEEFDSTLIKHILGRTNNMVLNAIFYGINCGLAEDSDSNWASRVSQSVVTTNLKQDDYQSKFFASDRTRYDSYARMLVKPLQTFATKYSEAKGRYKEEVTSKDETKVNANTIKEELKDISDEEVEQVVNGEYADESDGANYDPVIIGAYNALNTYNYDGNIKLGDYIVDLGLRTYSDNISYADVYPLVDAITKGEVFSFVTCSVEQIAQYLLADPLEIKDTLSNNKEEIVSLIKAESPDGSDSISIWSGTDRDLYNQKVAITDDAIRKQTAGNLSASIQPKEANVSETINNIMMWTGWIWTGVMVIEFLNSIVSFIIVKVTGAVTIAAIAAAGGALGVLASICSAISFIMPFLNYFFIEVMVLVLIAMLTYYIYDSYFREEYDAETYTNIPFCIFDVSDSALTRYDVVRSNLGTEADLNGNDGKRWGALYYSKDSTLGSPITSKELEDMFVVQYDNAVEPSGYQPISTFGHSNASNFNTGSRTKETKSIYVFCKKNRPVNAGTNESADTYLESIKLVTDETETKAKNSLISQGYTVVDMELSPLSRREGVETKISGYRYTYIGYKTTKNKNNAVTDIRIMPNCTNQSISFGGANYALAGTTPSLDSIYYTCYASNGEPICADLLCVSNKDDIPENYYGVNMFSGGDAYNLSGSAHQSYEDALFDPDKFYNGVHYSNFNQECRYLCYKPSKYYGEDEGTKYLAGISLVSTRRAKDGSSLIDDILDAYGFKKLSEVNITNGMINELSPFGDYSGDDSEDGGGGWGWIHVKDENIETYLVYSETTDPKKAITGISSYTAIANSSTVPYSYGSISEGAYSLCSEIGAYYSQQSNKDNENQYFAICAFSNGGYFDIETSLSSTLSRYTCSCDSTKVYIHEPNTAYDLKDVHGYEFNCAPEDYEKVSWEKSRPRAKALYVRGPKEGKQPLTISDVVVTSEDLTKDKTYEDYQSVQDAKTPYRTEPHNLAWKTAGGDEENVYIFYKSSEPKNLKYIKSISVSSYDFKALLADDESYKASDSKQRDDIEKQYSKQSHEICVTQLLAYGTRDVLPYNLSSPFHNSPIEKSSGYSTNASYVSVERTNNPNEAITGIIKYSPKDGQEATPTIQVKGATYTKAGDLIKDGTQEYYLYYTYNSGAVPGTPIETIVVDTEPVLSNHVTMGTAIEVDYTVNRKNVNDYGIKVQDEEANYIHVTSDEKDSYVEGVYIAHGDTKKNAQAQLLNLGATHVLDYNLNDKCKDGEYVYIGYSKFVPDGKTLTAEKYAIKDMVYTVGVKPYDQIIMTSDGVFHYPDEDGYGEIEEGIVYTKAYDEYKYNNGNNVSLNSGTGNESVYLYYTVDATNDTKDPINKVALVSGRGVMFEVPEDGVKTGLENSWENVLTVDNKTLNLSYGAYMFDGDNAIKSTAKHLFVHRKGCTVKPAGLITGGVTGDTEEYGKLTAK